jgi:tetratricopeptide (TPR) repeat protein
MPVPKKSYSKATVQEGKRLFNLRRWDLALQEMLRVDQTGSSAEEKTEISYYLGLCYTKLEKYDDALLHLEQVVTANPNTLRVCQCRMTLAFIYVATRRYKMAEFELAQLVKKGFESTQIYTTLAYAAWAQKSFDKAVELYEKALEMDGNNTTAMNGVGYILVDNNIDISRGMRYCKKAVEKKPQNAAYLDSLGWAYYKSGNMDEARTWLRRAMDIAPQQGEIRSHMKRVVEDTK